MPDGVYLIDGARTPQGRYGGALASVRPDDLAALVVAGGVESVTRAPWVIERPGTPWSKPGQMYDTSLGWRFTNPRFSAADRAVPADAGPETATLLGRLEREDARRGLATLCVGVGQGAAMLVERV